MTFATVSPVSLRTVRMCLSTALAAGLLAGCTANGPHPGKFAAAAQSAIAKGRTDKAVALAEQAVAADGRNSAYRLLLGNAYFRAGRFEAARTAYDEAMQLGEDGGKAALSLALTDIALGQTSQAVDTLNLYSDSLQPADAGLALALAGRTQEGVAVLVEALRRGENTPKLRQNLAYAYALDGSWREARMMAAQDVPADQLNARLQEWAAMAAPQDQRRRVAALLHVPVGAAQGQPAALALANFPAPANPADKPAGADEAPALARAAVGELPAAAGAAADAAPAPALADASSLSPPAQLAAIDLPASRSAPVPSQPTVIAASAPLPATAGTHIVQLGSFRTEEGAKRAWRHFSARNPVLAGHASLISHVTVRGRDFWRVQAAGFDGYSLARGLCGTLKARGNPCLVMAAASAATVPAARPATGLASAARRRADPRFARR